MINKKLRIALVHDYLKEYGGAESVLEVLSDMFPDAPIFTALYSPSFFGPHASRLKKKWSHRIHQSFFRYIPFAPKLISPLRLLSPLAFKSFNFAGYDLIISSATGAYFPNALNKKQAKLFCYCHTPPRYLYGLPTARNLTRNKIIFALVSLINHFLRLFDFAYSRNVDQYIANSHTTAKRIEKYYRKPSVVVNPPVDIPSSKSPKSSKNIPSYYLTGGRLARAKRYDIAIQACNQLKIPLKIFGRDFANFQAELKSISGPTIEFLGEVTQQQKARLFSEAQAYFMCSDNEDFGIVSVESMGYGTPVIGYNSGGVAETVVDGKTGVLFNELTPQSCIAAVKKFKTIKLASSDCLKRALEFNSDKFILKITKLINSHFSQT